MTTSETQSAQHDDEPLNDLEKQLAELMEGKITQIDFLRTFLTAQLYIMVDGEPTGGVLGDKKPMVIAASPEAPRLLAVFSSPTRAKRMTEQFAEYSFPILVDAAWALEHTGSHMGLAFNPGCANGFELAPEGAEQLRQAVAEARSQTAE